MPLRISTGGRLYDPSRGVIWVPTGTGMGDPYPWMPRAMRAFARGDLGALVSVAQPILGYTPGSNQFELVGGQRTKSASTSPAPTTSSVSVDAVRYRRLARSGGGVKEWWHNNWGAFTFHHIVDPTGPTAGWSIIMQDLVSATFTAGNAWLFFGFHHFNTLTDETSKVGALWWIDSVDQLWNSGVYGGTGTPSTELHETQHADLDAAGPHRLGIMLDADTKSVLFYANGVAVDAYTPGSPLGEMGNTPLLMVSGITEAAANASIDTLGGGNPRFLTFLPAGS